MSIQKTWSKYKSSIEGPVKQRLDLYKNPPSVEQHIYGVLKSIESELNYDDKFKSGIRVKIDFLGRLNAFKDYWFPLDISPDKLLMEYGSLESIKARIAAGETFYIKLSHRPTKIASGLASIATDFAQVLDNNDQFDFYSLSTLINGMNNAGVTIKKVIKPLGLKKYNATIEVADKSIKLAANGKNFVEINEAGVTIGADNLNLQMLPENVKFAGGLITMQSVFLGLIPSTGATPIPQYNFNFPIEGLELAASIASIMSSIVGT